MRRHLEFEAGPVHRCCEVVAAADIDAFVDLVANHENARGHLRLKIRLLQFPLTDHAMFPLSDRSRLLAARERDRIVEGRSRSFLSVSTDVRRPRFDAFLKPRRVAGEYKILT